MVKAAWLVRCGYRPFACSLPCFAALILLVIVSGGCAGIDAPFASEAQAAGHPIGAIEAIDTPDPQLVPDRPPISHTPTSALEPPSTLTPRPPDPPITATPVLAIATIAPTATATPRATSTPRVVPPGVTPAPFFGGITTSGNPKTRVVALTFDSESSAVGNLGDMLDTFRKSDMQATFFVLGIWADRNPQWVRRIIDEGHEIGTHSNTHPDFSKIGDAQVLTEIRKSEQAIERASGGQRMSRLLRPPFGTANRRTLDLAARQGYETIKWNADPEDWRDETPIGNIIRIVGQRAQPGDIVVMHLHVTKTADAMPAILESLQTRGLRSGTISQVLGRKP